MWLPRELAREEVGAVRLRTVRRGLTAARRRIRSAGYPTALDEAGPKESSTVPLARVSRAIAQKRTLLIAVACQRPPPPLLPPRPPLQWASPPRWRAPRRPRGSP